MRRNKFIVALTADFFDERGQPKYRDVGLSLLDAQPHIERRAMAGDGAEIDPGQIGTAHALYVMAGRISARSVTGAENLLHIARFGVGYDSVDIPACTEAGILVTITKGAVDYSVAEATLGWMIALGHHIRAKDELVRTARWNDRSRFMGRELRHRTLGVIGLGGIARKTLELARVFGMNQPLAFDPFVSAADGVRMVGLQELLRESDYVSIHCPLTDQTRGLIGPRELAWMKTDACLINTARGGIVDEKALFDALQNRRIAGAAIDCFVGEPLTLPPRFASLDNVLLAPHSIAWTEEQFRSIGHSACQAMVDFSLGRRPHAPVNPEVYDRPGFQEKWKRALG
jgi:phosphoglycerate dehydrogenase-like enzyme